MQFVKKMVDLFDYFRRKFFSLYTHTSPNINSRKRRLSSEIEPDINSFKMRKTNVFDMPKTSSPNGDDIFLTPSTSNYLFKKPILRSPKRYISPIRRAEVIDLSLSDGEDDEDIIEISSKDNDSWQEALREKSYISSRKSFIKPRSTTTFYGNPNKANPSSIIRKAKTTQNHVNRVLNSNNSSHFRKSGNVLNESFRIEEKDKYRELLKQSIRNLSNPFYKLDDYLSNRLKSKDKKIQTTSFLKKSSDVQKKIGIIDLTEEENRLREAINSKPVSIDSDSENDIQCITLLENSKTKPEPINSLKKILETEPVMNGDWLKQWNHRYEKSFEEKQKLIKEEEIKRNKFSDVNRSNVQQRLEEKLKSCMRISDIVLLDEEEEIEEVPVLPDLTPEQEKAIDIALKPEPRNQVLIDKFSLRITRNDIQTLKGLNWLNDEVINFYVNMLAERGNGSNPNLPRVHSMNTFFYPKLSSQGYSSLRRWTKKVDVFAQHMLVIPIHLGMHWCMSIIDFRDKSIKYYDSMGSPNPKCLSLLQDYLKQEHMDKKKSEYTMEGWKMISVRDIPQQMNGSDCGMFACMYAEFLTRNCKISFTQEHMPYFRRKMIYEIISGQLMLK